MNRYQKYFLLLLLAIAGFLVFRKYNGASASRSDLYPGYSKVRVIVDSAAHFYVEAVLTSPQFFDDNSTDTEFDSVHGTWAYTCSKAKNGPIEVALFSLLNGLCTRKIDLRSDTTIFISKNELPKFRLENDETPDLAHMQAGQEISIGLHLQGCFGGYFEKLSIHKKEKGYSVQFGSMRSYEPVNLEKDLGEDFSDTLALFQKRFKRFFNGGITGFCTTTSTFIFSNKTSFWKFRNMDCTNDSTGYEELLRSLNIPWPEPKNYDEPKVADTSMKLGLTLTPNKINRGTIGQ
jgi:hypothetical protein